MKILANPSTVLEKKRVLIISLILLVFNIGVFCQNYCDSHLLTNINIYNDQDIQIITDIQYGQAKNNSGIMTSLLLDVYRPNSNINPFEEYPLIILVHGGGFKGGSKNGMKGLAKQLAMKGYVVSSINYRLGWDSGTNRCNGDTTDLKMAIYRAVQDLNASIRFLKHNAALYSIDTNNVFIGGSSAGSGTCLWGQFLSQDDFNNWIPGVEENLGGLNSSGNDFVYSTKAKGICNMWGSITDTAHLTVLNALPVISFHGDHDPTVPLDTGRFKNCYDPMSIKMHGSRALHNKLINIGICSELNVQVNGRHGVYDDLHIAERTACFFRSIICGTCSNANNINTVKADCKEITGFNDYSNENTIIVSPNPFNDKLHITNADKYFQVEISNSTGQLLWSGNNIIQKDLSDLPSGFYLLSLNSSHGKEIYKLIKK